MESVLETSLLEIAFDKMRGTRNYEWLLKPFLRARLYVAARASVRGDQPIFYPRPRRAGDVLCLTASEFEARIAGNPGVVPIVRTGVELVTEMDRTEDLLLLYHQGGEYLGTEDIDWFREAIRLDPRWAR